MGITERKKRARENLKQIILEAAQEMLIQEGFENISMRKIAEKIEYSPTTIYLYFKDKRELFGYLMAQYFTKLQGVLAEVYDEKDDPITAMKKGIRAYIDCGLQNPNYYKLGFMINPDIDKGDYLKNGVPGTNVYLGHRALVEKCIRQGCFRSMDVDIATQVIWTMNHGITSLLISNPNFPWIDREKLITQDIESTIDAFKA
jgi:AcrR family transcriptional regulator